MNLRSLEFFLTVAEENSISRAAERLHISQPTLSYQIKTLEDEMGFRIFDRKGKAVQLTPAGAQFCEALQNIRTDLQRAMEQAQNFSSKYSESISIGMSVRSQLRLLPEAITCFASTNPTTEVVPYFQYYGMADSFLRGEKDILFALYDNMRRYPELKFHRLYTSRVYLITELSDPLARKELIRAEDLEGRTLMVGGGSPNALKAVQQRVIRTVHVDTINSPDHDNTLTNVAAHKGVCLAPGFLNDYSGQFAWIPFDCEENFPCVLCTHSADNRKEVLDFVRTLQEIYGKQDPKCL